MLERAAPEGGDLGLGSELALQAVDRSAWSPERLQHIIGPGVSKPGPILPPTAEPFFRTELVAGAGGRHLEPRFAVVVGIAGTGELNGNFPGGAVPLRRGSTILVPFGAGPTHLSGDVEVIVCRPADSAVKRPSRPIT